MKKENLKKSFIDNYTYINYFIVFVFLIVNLILGREYRNITSTFFIIIMLPLLVIKIKNELNYDKENGTKSVQKTLIRMLLILGLLFIIYYLI
jgi:hypothetical protein